MKGVLTFPRKYVIMNPVRQTERLTEFSLQERIV